jgi:perosamine synthetase
MEKNCLVHMKITFFNTHIHSSAFKKVSDVFKTTFLSEGEMVKKFEEELAKKLGWVNPVAVNSGTSALHLALILAGVKEGDEVICPAQTFIATGMAILYQRAKPVFADIKYETGNIDPKSFESEITSKTKAIIPVHWSGNPCDMDEIHSIAEKHSIAVIEDAAHATGALYKNKPIGSISEFTCFSFQAIKHITTGDGGAVCSLKKTDEERCRKLRWFGIDRKNAKPSILGEREYDTDEIGYKYHLNDYGAVLGLSNLSDFESRMEKRRKIATTYREKLRNVAGLRLLEESADRKSAYWLFGMHVEKRNDFIQALKDRGVPTSVVHLGIDKNRIFGGKDNSLRNQRKFDATQIHIPIHDGLSIRDVDYIVKSIQRGW